MSKKLTDKDILGLTIYPNDKKCGVTVKQSLVILLKKMLEEIEFDGIATNSWFHVYDEGLIKCFVINKLIPGVIDEKGYLNTYHDIKYRELVCKLVCEVIKDIVND